MPQTNFFNKDVSGDGSNRKDGDNKKSGPKTENEEQIEILKEILYELKEINHKLDKIQGFEG